MLKNRWLWPLLVGLTSAGAVCTLSITRAGSLESPLKSAVPGAAANGQLADSDIVTAGRGGAAIPDTAAGEPDKTVLDKLLSHGWNNVLYQSRRPKLQKEEIGAPYVALTFDDGPKSWGTPLVLDQLEKYRAHATFFLVGSQCVKFPELVSRIVADGDEIGNHTYDHPRLPTVTLPQVAEELERNRDTIYQLTGQTMFLFRPPGGRTNAEVQTLADSLGYTTVFWRLDSGELSSNMNPEKVYHRVADNVQNGDIVLLHNGDPNIVAALPNIMETLSQRGFQFVTVSELMQLSGARPVEQVYTPRFDAE